MWIILPLSVGYELCPLEASGPAVLAQRRQQIGAALLLEPVRPVTAVLFPCQVWDQSSV